jgi:Protein of unknown function, DUF488
MPGKLRRRPHGESVCVHIARVYDDVEPGRYRVLVDRLWPRGVSRAAARFDVCMKDIAPTAELRTWYGHAPERFPEFSPAVSGGTRAAPARAALDQPGRDPRRRAGHRNPRRRPLRGGGAPRRPRRALTDGPRPSPDALTRDRAWAAYGGDVRLIAPP